MRSKFGFSKDYCSFHTSNTFQPNFSEFHRFFSNFLKIDRIRHLRIFFSARIFKHCLHQCVLIQWLHSTHGGVAGLSIRLLPQFSSKLFRCLLNRRSVVPDFFTRILITFDLLLNESVGSGQLDARWATLLSNSLSLILLIFHLGTDSSATTSYTM
jgi:hypothetical protein